MTHLCRPSLFGALTSSSLVMMPLHSSGSPSLRRVPFAKENALSRPFSERRSRLSLLGRSIAEMLRDRADELAALGAALVLVGGRPCRPEKATGGSSRSGLKAWRGERALCRGMRGEARRGASMVASERWRGWLMNPGLSGVCCGG